MSLPDLMGQSSGRDKSRPYDYVTSAKMLYKQHLVVARTVVVERYGRSVYQAVARLNIESHAGVEPDGAYVPRRGAGSDDHPPVLQAKLEEELVQQPAQALLTVMRVNADEMDIGLLVVGRGEESYQEADHPEFVLRDERGVTEVHKENP